MPCPTPDTTAATINPNSDEKYSAAVRMAMPAASIAQPTATARCGGMRVAPICATADAAKIEQAMAPATARLSVPMTPARNDGATAVYRPSTANPANAASAAMTNTARTSAGTESRCTPMLPALSAVSGTTRTAMPAMTASAMWMRNGTCSGCGAYCASRPASSGPVPRPPMVAIVATVAARECQRGGAASMMAAVAVPVNRPADNPDSTRPTSSCGTESAIRNTTALASAATTPASSTGRLPTASDHRPNTSSANSMPPAYVA